MGKGEDELFEKKLSKEEKKALAKAKREAKKKVCSCSRSCETSRFYSYRNATSRMEGIKLTS